MLQILRHHRLRLGRSLVGLLALAWMTVALQPCATAQASTPPPAAAMVHHHGDHGMEMGSMDHTSAHQQQAPCPPGADCPVFKAVDGQAATKAADTVDLPVPPPAALTASWPQPLFASAAPVYPRVARFALPAPPILEFRVLLI